MHARGAHLDFTSLTEEHIHLKKILNLNAGFLVLKHSTAIGNWYFDIRVQHVIFINNYAIILEKIFVLQLQLRCFLVCPQRYHIMAKF